MLSNHRFQVQQSSPARFAHADPNMHLEQQIADFLAGETFAVVGASANRHKYGNKVLRLYQQLGLSVTPVNPREAVIEGLPVVASLSEMSATPHAISIITPPEVTEQIVAEAIAIGLHHIWMQPGAENDTAIDACRQAKVKLIHSGPCILVALGYRQR